MITNVKWRLIALALSICMMVSLSVWAALASWNRTDEVRRQLTQVQSDSFHLADRFQQSILNLNNLLLRYRLREEPSTWRRFLQVGEEFESWIGTLKPEFNTPDERRILEEFETTYKTYFSNARLYERTRPIGGAIASLEEFAPLEVQSEKLLELAYQLANAHRKTLNQFLARSDSALATLRNVLLASLFLLLWFGAGLAVVIYRQMIAPLRLKVLESRELLERQEKLASLGMLAAGVAHEIRNPLTAMKARLFAAKRVRERDAAEQDDLDVIDREISRLERIVNDFLMFARPSDPSLAEVDAMQPLRDVQGLLAPSLEKNEIRLVVEESQPLPILVDVHQIKQVLINLVQNAADSIGENGSITLRARTDTLRLAGRATDAAVLEVIDTGKGIPAEVQNRLFDPFFTTKAGGTGLGLAIAARIVEKHGGSLRYQSQVKHGTTFGLVLPLKHRERQP